MPIPISDVPEPAAALMKLIRGHQASIGIIGLGYVGLPLALMFAEVGYTVTGFDIDQRKVDDLQASRSYILNIAADAIRTARSQGFNATSNFDQLANQDIILLCVPTPLTEHREPDLTHIENTARSVAPCLRPGQLVILESTTYPGTTDEILIPLLEAFNKQELKAQGVSAKLAEGVFYVAFSPEREDPGNNTVARRDIPKVVGGHDVIATELAATLYESIFTSSVRVSCTRVAEMTKLLENIYRCVNIALINEMKLLSLRMDIDIWEVIDAAATKPFGFQPFYPGPGLGGHCIPIDPFYLSWKAKEYNFQARFIELAGEVNDGMPEFVVQQVVRALNQQRKAVNGSRILILGVSYKKNIDDLRESPSLRIIELLRGLDAEVMYNDPYHPQVECGQHFHFNMTSAPLDDLGQYDCVLIATDHSEYDYEYIARNSQLLVDTRNATKGLKASHIFRC